MIGPRLRLVAVGAVAALLLPGLVVAGSGTLAPPPTGSWVAFEAWYERVGAATGMVVMLRLIAMVGCAWLLLAATLQMVASRLRRQGLRRLADAVSPRVLRRIGHGVASLSVTAGLAVPSVVGLPRNDPPGTAVMQVVDEPDMPTTTTAPPPPALAPRATIDDEVVVRAGQSFWSLAVDVLTDVRGPEPDDREVTEYWQRLIDANRGRLVDPANPDLIFPTQTFTLPAP